MSKTYLQFAADMFEIINRMSAADKQAILREEGCDNMNEAVKRQFDRVSAEHDKRLANGGFIECKSAKLRQKFGKRKIRGA